MIYLDSSALVKIIHPEAETEALRDWLAECSDLPWVSSTLLEVEVPRAVCRFLPDALDDTRRALDLVELVPMGLEIRLCAQAVQPATVRSLDAIHLATALKLRDRLTAFVTYDTRLADAARLAGLKCEAPA